MIDEVMRKIRISFNKRQYGVAKEHPGEVWNEVARRGNVPDSAISLLFSSQYKYPGLLLARIAGVPITSIRHYYFHDSPMAFVHKGQALIELELPINTDEGMYHLAHELAHVSLGHLDRLDSPTANRAQMEVEADTKAIRMLNVINPTRDWAEYVKNYDKG